MSASGTRERLTTVDGVKYVAKTFLGVELSSQQAERYVYHGQLPDDDDDTRWMQNSSTVSAGPVVFLKSMLLADRFFECGCPIESDDLPIMHMQKNGRGKTFGQIAPVARSQIFRTIQFVFPIDLVARRVAGFSGMRMA